MLFFVAIKRAQHTVILGRERERVRPAAPRDIICGRRYISERVHVKQCDDDVETLCSGGKGKDRGKTKSETERRSKKDKRTCRAGETEKLVDTDTVMQRGSETEVESDMQRK